MAEVCVSQRQLTMSLAQGPQRRRSLPQEGNTIDSVRPSIPFPYPPSQDNSRTNIHLPPPLTTHSSTNHPRRDAHHVQNLTHVPRSLALCTWGSCGAAAYSPRQGGLVACSVPTADGRDIEVVEYVYPPPFLFDM